MTLVLNAGGVSSLVGQRARLAELRQRGLWPAQVPAVVLAEALTGDHRRDFHVNRLLEAGTNTKNIAEQKSLERVGFRREGVLREIGFQHGEWQDAVIYSMLRDEAPGQRSGAGAAG
jgi:hypothetical protein